MKKNTAGQSVGAQIITAADGTNFTGSVTAYYTIDNGTQTIGSVGSGVCTHEGNGYHSYAPTAAETNGDHIAWTFIGTGAITATVQVFTTFPQTTDQAYAGPRGPGVYLNDAAANTNTVDGIDGTITNPVSTIATAKTISDSLSLDRIYLVNDTAIPDLGDTFDDYEFIGIGSPSSNSIVLGSRSINNSSFFNLTISGTQGGSARANFEDCLIGETISLRCFARRCGFTDSAVGTSFSNNDDIVLDQCFSTVAGNGTPIFLAPGAGVDAMFRHYSGGIELKDLNATATISIETIGQVVFSASPNNVNAAVTIRGFASITDNTAGMSNLTVDAVWNRTAYAADGSTLTAIDLPNQTMDITGNITGNLSGSVGSVTGNVGGVAGTIQTLDALDTELDNRHDSNDAKVDAIQLTLDGGVLVGSMGPNTITSTVIATDAITSDELAVSAINEIQSGLSTLVATDIVSAGAITTLAGAVVNVDLVDTITTYTGNTPQTADHTAAIATVDANVDTLLTRITSTLFSGMTSLAEWLGLMAGAQVPDATALAEIKTTGAGSGTYDATTDALEAIAEAGGGGAPTVEQIRTEMDTNSTQLAAIVSDTNELQTDWANNGRLDLILDACSTHDAAAVVTALDTGSTLTSLATVSALTAHDDAMSTAKSMANRWMTAVEIDGSGGYQYTTLALENAPSGGDATEAKQDLILADIVDIQGATFNTSTDSLEAIRDRGDTAWVTGSGGGGSGSGARTIVVTVKDSSDSSLLEFATVRVKNHPNNHAAETGVAGTCTFMLDDGDWTFAATRAGYEFEVGTITVSVAENPVEILMDQLTVLTPPTDPAKENVTVRLINESNGNPLVGVEVGFVIIEPDDNDGYVYLPDTGTVTSDSNGDVVRECIKGATYNMWSDNFETNFTLPASQSGTYSIGTIISKT